MLAQSKRLFVFGASGRIGEALMAEAGNVSVEPVALDREALNACHSVDAAQALLDGVGFSAADIVIVAAGEINPRAGGEVLHHVNVVLAGNAAAAATKCGGKAVTLGTVLETKVSMAAQNAYVAGKVELAEMSRGRWVHLRLNTVYGGPKPYPFMFIGQVLESLRSKRRFSMTAGQQRREYHHVDDEARAILTLSQRHQAELIDLNSGCDTSLAELARGVFRHFGRENLLGIGDMPSPEYEAYDRLNASEMTLDLPPFRDTVPAVCRWLGRYV
jgi:nucleoside-diphosphate-sugar epimerase